MRDWARRQDWERLIANAIYLALLAVLFPHTAWMFGQFERGGVGPVAYAAAFAFEAAIYVLTKRLAKHIERTPRYTSGRVRWRRFQHRWLNAYAVGLFASIAVSSLANWAHAVEFAATVEVYGAYGIPPLLFSVGFGGVLSFVSLLFALVLAEMPEAEADSEVADLRRELAQAERRARKAEDAARFVLELAAEDKARRIEAARGLGAHIGRELPQSMIAVLADASPSYVSEVLRGNGDGQA